MSYVFRITKKPTFSPAAPKVSHFRVLRLQIRQPNPLRAPRITYSNHDATVKAGQNQAKLPILKD